MCGARVGAAREPRCGAQASHELLVRDVERAATERVVKLLVNVVEGMVCTRAQDVSIGSDQPLEGAEATTATTTIHFYCTTIAVGAQVNMIQRSMHPSCKIHRCTLFSHPTSSEIGSATIAPEPLNSCSK